LEVDVNSTRSQGHEVENFLSCKEHLKHTLCPQGSSTLFVLLVDSFNDF